MVCIHQVFRNGNHACGVCKDSDGKNDEQNVFLLWKKAALTGQVFSEIC
jgi:hypothetical protein